MPTAEITPLDCCLKLEQELTNISDGLYNSVAIEGRGETFGTIRYVNDLANSAGFQKIQVQVPFDKSKPGDPTCTDRDVRVKYLVPECCEEAVDVCNDLDCAPIAATRETWSAETVCVEDCVYTEFAIDSSMYDCSCEDPQEGIAIAWSRAVRKFARLYARKLREKIVASLGTAFAGGAPTGAVPLPLKVFRTGVNGELLPQPMGWYEVEYEYMRQAPNSSVKPLMLTGSKKLGAYGFGRSLYSGNDEGFDANRIGVPYNVYQDWELNAALAGIAQDPIISIMPGSFDLLEWFKYDNPNYQVGTDGALRWAPVQISTGEGLLRQKMDIGSAILGFPLYADVQTKVSACDNRIEYKIRKDFDIWCPPQAAMCGTNNFKLLWDAVCDTYTCDDICSPEESC